MKICSVVMSRPVGVVRTLYVNRHFAGGKTVREEFYWVQSNGARKFLVPRSEAMRLVIRAVEQKRLVELENVEEFVIKVRDILTKGAFE